MKNIVTVIKISYDPYSIKRKSSFFALDEIIVITMIEINQSGKTNYVNFSRRNTHTLQTKEM